MKLSQYLTEQREQLKDWNKYVKTNKMIQSAVKVLNTINKKKYRAYIVGGAVRDIVLGMQPKDIDIATNMPIEELQKVWRTHDIGKSKDFGIVVVVEGGSRFEVAQFRTDGKYADGRRPENVKIAGSFEEDAGRRDFTINAMGIDSNGVIYDYFDGKKDIKNKVLRTVGDPRKRFGEDKLRMMRAARFSAKYEFDIDKETEKAAKKVAGDITKLPYERIKEELFKAASLGGHKFANYLKILDKLKILQHILPELITLKIMPHAPADHPEGGVWAHTMKALEVSNTTDPVKNLAILLHDVGKATTIAPGVGKKAGKPTYYHHAEMSVRLVNTIAKRLKLSNAEKQAILFAVGNHMKFHNILKMRPGKIARLVSDENWDVLVAVARADEFSRGETFKHAGEFEKIVDKAIKIKKKHGIESVNRRFQLVGGDHIMNITGLKPGPKIGEIIRKTTEWILDQDVQSQTEIDEYIRGLV
jgi:tRNA nucleotidyltransferase/poly(A) polymerase